MQAMILAAGQGTRLRPLTLTTPKPLIEVGGLPLIVWHLLRLKSAGITDIIVNSAYLSEQITSYLGQGTRFGVKITHSVESVGGLETAGGIIRALKYFKDEYFLVINADIFVDTNYQEFLNFRPPQEGAHLFMIPNPEFKRQGDFDLIDGRIRAGTGYTFSGIALYAKRAFSGQQEGFLPLKPFFERFMQHDSLTGSLYTGAWFDVGTIERLKQVEEYIKGK